MLGNINNQGLLIYPQFEGQFSSSKVEGERSQENLPNQKADQDQVDLSVTHGEPLTTASTYLVY